MKKILLSTALFCASFMANAQCTAVSTLNETFENFVDGASGGLPQNCWTSADVYPRVSVATVSGNKILQLYSSSTFTVPMYVVSPELNTIDGAHKLSFNIGATSASGVLKLQVGTLASPSDFTNFTPVGSEITIVGASTQSDIIIPASATQKYIVFRVVSAAPHSVTSIDNIVWQSTLGVNDSKLASLSVYPNPSVDRNVTISYNNDVVSNDKNTVAVYNLAGAKVFEAQMQENIQTLNLSELASGIYILKLQSGSNVATKKLVLK